jgi:Xaa-Pro aminopeptidase
VNQRVGRLVQELDGLAAAAFLVTDPVNVLYLTGFESSNAAVLVDRETVRLFTDGRYITAATAIEDVEAIRVERDVAAHLGANLAALAQGRVAFEADHLTVAARDAVAASGAELVPAVRVVKSLRAVKEESELTAVRRAARILHDAFERLVRHGFEGRTEAELAWWMTAAIHEEGADAVAFDTIVAGGPNAALPHHHPGSRPIGPGETVIVDAGAKVGGYSSDCTRTFATGRLPEALQQAYATCQSTQETALAGVRPGASAQDLDALARREIEHSGLAEVLHGLGHGVGLEIHELPVLSKTSDETLAAGNVVTVEPGVYLPGVGGVRIEDLVIVTKVGAEILTPFTKDLVEVV